MPLGLKQMMDAANAAVPRITPDAAREVIAQGNALVLDVRDGAEVAASGKVAGARQESQQGQNDPGLLRLRRPLRLERKAAQRHGL